MIRSKSAFRAVRESVGMTQAALAAELGVQVRSIKRWESSEAPQEPPADAWEVLQKAYRDQLEIIQFALVKARELDAELPDGAERTVALPYWPDAETYGRHSTDSRLGVAGDWRMANASVRAAAILLRDRGYLVEFVNPGTYRFGSNI